MNRLGWLLFLNTIVLSVMGIFILYESSTYTALLNIGDKYFYVKYQIVWAGLGLIAALIVSRINYKSLYNLALPLLLVSVALLILVFFPGIGLELKGSHRWINLGFFVFQPSEILKITLAIYLAAWLSNKESGRLLAFLILFFVCIFLVAMEPDMGTAFIIAVSSIVVYFLSGSSIKDMGLILLICVVGSILLIKIEPYRVARFTSFQNFDNRDLHNATYHIKQILIALGSGGSFGVGPGKSIQKYAYLPENTSDSIFAIYAEETGFFGSFVLILMFVSQFLLGGLVAARAKSKFGKLLAAGIITFIATQTFVNLASQAVIMPLTGVPLPFISAGGSSLIINFISIGVLLSISRDI